MAGMLRIVPPSDCMRAREDISARLDGELAELDAVRLDLHLVECADCRAFAAQSGRVASTLRRADLEPVAGTLFAPVFRRRRVAGPLAAAVASLVVAAAAGSSALVGRLVAGHTAARTVPAATAASTSTMQVDSGLLALLRGDEGRRPGGRTIAV